ncbi:MAG: ankyrin repeat domain-containing protein [Alphaproteobacteria bacterium]|nr:ankyrin repeat domain-containing protein [Alphaproteobacteria bacterium]
MQKTNKNNDLQDPKPSLLFTAAKSGNAAAIDRLCKNGTNPDVRDKTQMTPLMWAVHEGQEDAVTALLDKGADVNAQCGDGWTPLYYAAVRGHRDVFFMLLDNGADVNIRDANNQTLLMHMSAASGYIWEQQRLIEEGVDVNAIDNEGNTALIKAAVTYQVANIELLVRAGADPDIKNQNDETAWDHLTTYTKDIMARERQEYLAKAFEDAAERGTTRAQKIIRPKKKDGHVPV